MTGSAAARDGRVLPKSTARSAARLAAVQALYQMDMTGIDVNVVIAEFAEHRLGREIEGAEAAPPDDTFFRDIVGGVVRAQRMIDPPLNACLATGWRLARIDSILRAILRSAAYELIERSDIPAKVVIAEYIDVAHAFFEGDEPKVVNGILDRLARQVRGRELDPSADAQDA